MDSVIKWLCEWNFPSAKPPKLWLLTKDEADELKQTQAWRNMANVGYRPTLETVEATFGGTWEPVPNGQKPSQDDASNFAEGDIDINDIRTRVDEMVDQLANEIEPITGGWIAQIKQALDDADSLEDLRDELETLAVELSFEDYARIFETANISAKLAGMQSVIDESAGEDDGEK